jgi:hypothetical protein
MRRSFVVRIPKDESNAAINCESVTGRKQKQTGRKQKQSRQPQ